MSVKYIFVTGGVVSGLGKGITAASLGRLLKQRGLRVKVQKLDPYLNVDPGTMNPYQHGEVFVTDDGAETDLDLGHYERFIDENLDVNSSVSSGKVYWDVLNRERRGDYLGGTVQIIPHITGEIKSRIYRLDTPDTDVAIVEIGGTVGDIESQPFLESIRQVAAERGRNNVMFIHVSLIVSIPGTGELKSKPTQHSAKELLSLGIQPDVIMCRCDRPVPREILEKISLFCNIPVENAIPNLTAELLYEVPLMLEREGLADVVVRRLGLICHMPDLTEWATMVHRAKHPSGRVSIALVGKYVALHDAYLSVAEALTHAGIENGVKVDIRWIDSETVTDENAARLLSDCQGVLVPGGFGSRGVEGPHPVRPGEQGALPWHLSGDADGGGGVRPPRRRPPGGPLQRAGPPYPPPGHRPDVRSGECDGEGRHHASGELSLPSGGGQPRPCGLRPGRHRRAPPPPVRIQQRLPGTAHGGGIDPLRPVPRRAAGGDRGAGGPPLVCRRPVPPGAEKQAQPRPPPFPGVHRGGKALECRYIFAN